MTPPDASIPFPAETPPRPAEAPLSMPTQPLVAPRGAARVGVRSKLWRKAAAGLASAGFCVWATREMYAVVEPAGVTILEWMLLAVFAVNFTWIAFAFVTATAGFLSLALTRRSKAGDAAAPVTSRNALLFPIYNEDVSRVFATVEASLVALDARAPGRFEAFILSDTTDPDVALAEEEAFLALRRALPAGARAFYRRRPMNVARKSGNVHDFVSRWGGRYDHMIVFDADSVMEAETILSLARRMEADPGAGLIQTVPRLVGGESLFARAQAFAAGLYGPALGAGVAWWAQAEGNFWGHNAIIRVRAFAESAGLPDLGGAAPFGGPIMSHDFVEAALLRRAGWGVRIAHDLGGSYEECPPTIIDLAVRDRRWCQGNLQHAGVLARARGLSWTNRLHLMIGVMAYLASPMWLFLILVGMALSLQARFLRPEYFTSEFQLFPDWPVIDDARALALFGITMGVLFAPKLYGLLWGLGSRAWRRGVGPIRLVAGVLVETIISVLIAPILMLAQTTAVASILSGRDAGWTPQKREGGYRAIDVWRRHMHHTIFGAVLIGAALAISPIFAAWLSPAAVGLLLSAPISLATGSETFGRALRRLGLLVTPEERRTPESLAAAIAARPRYRALEAPKLEDLFVDPGRARRRAGLVDNYWPLGPSDIHTPSAVAAARLERAATPAAALADMSKAERLAVANAPTLIENAARRRPTAEWLAAS